MAKKDPQANGEQTQVTDTGEVLEGQAPADGRQKRGVIKMSDGRDVDFGVRGLIKTDTNITGEAPNRAAELTFDVYSGNTFKFSIDNNSPALLELAIYGAKQKIGDSIAVTDNAQDADAAIERVIQQLNNGIWVQRQATGGEARGFTDFWHACLEYKKIEPKDAEGNYTQAALDYKAFLQSKDDDSLKAMRAFPQIKATMARYVAERAAAKAQAAVSTDASSLF